VTYFPDLSPYSYSGAHPGVVNVGWLDGVHPFPKGSVEARLVKKMSLMAANPVYPYFGRHLCEICVAPPDVVLTYTYFESDGALNGLEMIDPECSWAKWQVPREGNGEIRVAGFGVTFAAPVLIVHYIEEHGYLPPSEFLEAIDKAT